MAFVKKNLFSIIFGVVALVAIALAFFPLGSFYDDIQASMKASADRYTKAGKLLGSPRVFPVSTPGGKAEPLTGFPTQPVIVAAQTAQQGLRAEARDIRAEAVLKNMLEFLLMGRTLDVPDLAKFYPDADLVKKAMLLTADSLPDPTAQALFDFQTDLDKEYRKLRCLLLRSTAPTAEELDKAPVDGLPPDQAKVKAALTKLRLQKDTQLKKLDPDKPALNQVAVDSEYETEKVKIPARLQYETAQKILMYLDPSVLQMDPALKSGSLTKEQIWYAQVALWVHEDVVRALKETNELPLPASIKPSGGPPVNVQEAPIKRLVKLDVVQNSAVYQRNAVTAAGGGGGGGGGTPGASAEAIPGAGELPKQNVAISASGRSCNSVYDVVVFNLVVDIDSRAMQVFLNQLSHGRLIAVRKMEVAVPDLTVATSYGYVYGPAPVVQLNLECEALMLRDWTIPLMPTGGTAGKPSIREMFSVPANWVSSLAPAPGDPNAATKPSAKPDSKPATP